MSELLLHLVLSTCRTHHLTANTEQNRVEFRWCRECGVALIPTRHPVIPIKYKYEQTNPATVFAYSNAFASVVHFG